MLHKNPQCERWSIRIAWPVQCFRATYFSGFLENANPFTKKHTSANWCDLTPKTIHIPKNRSTHTQTACWCGLVRFTTSPCTHPVSISFCVPNATRVGANSSLLQQCGIAPPVATRYPWWTVEVSSAKIWVEIRNHPSPIVQTFESTSNQKNRLIMGRWQNG